MGIDTLTNTVTTSCCLVPYPIIWAAPLVVGSKIYNFGGYSNDGTLGTDGCLTVWQYITPPTPSPTTAVPTTNPTTAAPTAPTASPTTAAPSEPNPSTTEVPVGTSSANKLSIFTCIVALIMVNYAMF